MPLFLDLFLAIPVSGIFWSSILGLEWLPSEVVKAEGKQTEHNDADEVVVEEVGVREAPELPMASTLLREAFEKFNADSEQANDSSSCDEA